MRLGVAAGGGVVVGPARGVTRYNTRRRHSYCGQQAPIVYEQQHTGTLRLVG